RAATGTAGRGSGHTPASGVRVVAAASPGTATADDRRRRHGRAARSALRLWRVVDVGAATMSAVAKKAAPSPAAGPAVAVLAHRRRVAAAARWIGTATGRAGAITRGVDGPIHDDVVPGGDDERQRSRDPKRDAGCDLETRCGDQPRRGAALVEHRADVG